MSKAVLAGELMHVSASQITTHQRCARKWWYEKVAGLQAPSSGALETGTRVHAQMEGYLLDGIEPEFPSAKKLIQDPDFPIPESDHPAFMVEEPRDYKLGLFAAGIPVKGRIDLVDGRAGSTVDIWDWKTTAQLSYGKTAEELAYNTQLIIYGKWAFACSIFNPDYVRFRHGYIQTRGGAKARIVGTQPLSRDHVEDQYESIVDEVVTMKRSAAASNAEKVPANPLACKDFGGCPFANTCTRGAKSAAERLSFLFAAEREKENEMSLKDALRAEGINPPDAAKPSVKKPERRPNAQRELEGATKHVERSRRKLPLPAPSGPDSTSTSTSPRSRDSGP